MGNKKAGSINKVYASRFFRNGTEVVRFRFTVYLHIMHLYERIYYI
ncbi:MAG: hypothetical protein JWQ14_1299 [Adhaeribacter sp.]|nr:hypothetical protein [Adhaeribacter sp.]